MQLQNGYKIIYEKAADGKRTFYASRTGKCDTTVDTKLADFTDSEYKGKTVYVYKGKFYISAGKLPKYDETGKPAEGETELTAFDEVFVKAEVAEAAAIDEDFGEEEPENEPEDGETPEEEPEGEDEGNIKDEEE